MDIEAKIIVGEAGTHTQHLNKYGHQNSRTLKKKFSFTKIDPDGNKIKNEIERDYVTSNSKAKLISKVIYALRNKQSEEAKILPQLGMDYIENHLFRPNGIWFDRHGTLMNADQVYPWQTYLDFDEMVGQPLEEKIGIDEVVKSRGRIKRGEVKDQLLGFQRRTARQGATRTMQPERGNIPKDKVKFVQSYVPVPFIYASFDVGARSQQIQSVFKENGLAALRAVRESVTELYLNGDTDIGVEFGDSVITIRGLLNATGIQSEAQLSGTNTWSEENVTGGNSSPYNNIVGWVNSLQKNKLAQGPYFMLFGQDAYTALKWKVTARDYTHYHYLRENMGDVEAMPAGRYQEMADNQVILVDADSLAAGVVTEPSMTQIMHGNGLFADSFAVYCAETPVIIPDGNGRTGISKVLVS